MFIFIDESVLTLAKGLLCACLIMIIVMASVAPKLLCRWCHNKESHDHNEYEDDVIYGEFRYPDEPHNKPIHTTHFTNALYYKCTEGIDATSDSNAVTKANNNIQSSCTCERDTSRTPNIPAHCGSDNNRIIKKSECMQGTTMNKNTSSFTTKDNNLKEREAIQTPEVPPYYGNDDDGVTMTQNPSSHLERNFLTEDNNITVNCNELVPSCERETNHNNLAVSPYHVSDDDDDDDESITMSRNPSYHLGRNLFTELNTLDSTELLSASKRETGQIPHISPYNDSDNVGVTQNAHFHLERNFYATANKVNGTELAPCELESYHIAPIPSYNGDVIHNAIKRSGIDTDSIIIMTDNPSYQFEKDFFVEQ